MKKTIAIIGAGITGLTLGWKLSKDYNVLIIEKENQIGGICSSFKKDNFSFDYGPHKLYPQNKVSLNAIKELYSSNPADLLEVYKKSKISLNGKFFSYPLKITELLTKFNIFLAAKLMFSYSYSLITNFVRKEPKNYEDFVISKFGKGIYNIVFKSNAQKIWGNPKELSADLAKTRISSPNLATVIINTLLKSDDPSINAKTFFYPKNSILDLMNHMADKMENGKILLNSTVDKVIKEDNKIKEIIVNGRKIKVDYLISTSYLSDSLSLLNAPKDIIELANNLKFRDLYLVYLIFDKKRILKDNWLFFPGKKFIFQRISEQKSFSSFNQPENKSALIAEISARPEIEKLSEKEIIDIVISNLSKIGINSPISSAFVVKKTKIYPIYDLKYKSKLKQILGWIDNNTTNFITCGRNGLFNYNNMDHCMDMAIKLSEHLKSSGSVQGINKLRKYFETYKIVD